MVVGWGVVAAMAMGGEMMAAVVVTVEVATVAAVAAVVAVAAAAMVVAALAMTGTCSMAHRAPIPLAAPNTHGGIEGGYGTHDNSACDGVRGFEGSGVRGSRFDSRGPHPYGIIGPRGPVTSKRSSPEAWIPALERKNFIAPHDHPGITCAYYIDKACEHTYKRLGRAR